MPTAVRISDNLLNEARKFSKIDHRSLTGQIEHWANIENALKKIPTSPTI